MKKRLLSTPEFVWLFCFLVLAALAPTVFAKVLLLAICALLGWLYVR
ncbi:hypothetical protein [Paraburkholderia azotifigens]|uniref:O-antigen ligase family protein n=1 Tax=Paraburkholderia azotifigens TaxID=2057004 RepID=A0ABU9R794_9BURK|nr:hypothetical protein [Paraburkholderia azotifigens]